MRSARRLAAFDRRVLDGRPAQTKSRFPMKKRTSSPLVMGVLSRYMLSGHAVCQESVPREP
ncbi:hypothetical protein AB7303_19930 [Providencia rettgeri]